MNAEPKLSDNFYLGPEPNRIDRPDPPTPPPPPKSTADWRQVELDRLSVVDLEKLIASAEDGDEQAINAFERFLTSGGTAAWRELGDLAGVAEKTLLRALFGGQKGPALAARRRFQELRQQLSDDHATPLEKLAIDRVILASTFACAVDCLVASEGLNGLTSEKRAKAQELAERRVQGALKSLQLARQISRAAVAEPLRLFGSRSRSAESPHGRAASG